MNKQNLDYWINFRNISASNIISKNQRNLYVCIFAGFKDNTFMSLLRIVFFQIYSVKAKPFILLETSYFQQKRQ